MPPAAILLKKHICPIPTMVPLTPHAGQGMIMVGCPTVLIGKMPAARMGDMILCNGVPPHPDTIVKGSATVLIGKMPAARMGDMTAMGGNILEGVPTVMIGG